MVIANAKMNSFPSDFSVNGLQASVVTRLQKNEEKREREQLAALRKVIHDGVHHFLANITSFKDVYAHTYAEFLKHESAAIKSVLIDELRGRGFSVMCLMRGFQLVNFDSQVDLDQCIAIHVTVELSMK